MSYRNTEAGVSVLAAIKKCPCCVELYDKPHLVSWDCNLCGAVYDYTIKRVHRYTAGKIDPAEGAAYRTGGIDALWALRDAAA